MHSGEENKLHTLMYAAAESGNIALYNYLVANGMSEVMHVNVRRACLSIASKLGSVPLIKKFIGTRN